MSMVAARAVVLGGMMLGTGIRSGPHRSAFRNKSLHPALDTMDSLQGQLLIASTGLLDPNFARTVILVAAHGEEGALGLILNREMSVPLQQVWGQVSELPCLRSGNVRHGGPVGGTLMALHDLRIHANLVVTDDVFVATELSAMESLASSDDGLALFYIGHSGWGPGPRVQYRGGG
jgi:putative transcriptional regulator